MKKSVMQIETLTCPTCVKKIETALSNLAGVSNVKVLFNSSKAKFDFDETQIDAETLQSTVEKLGFNVESVKIS